jgi:prepilin-type N-terminal cleavage/methylation domain-containing protein
MRSSRRITDSRTEQPRAPGPKRARFAPFRRGHTLIELMVTVAVIGVLASFGVPRFTKALEQSRVDMAAANLRAIWTAQRLYWLKHQSYAGDLASLVSDTDSAGNVENFLDPSLDPSAGALAANPPSYVYQVTANSATDFTAIATRYTSSTWTSTLAIASDGNVTGNVVDPGGTPYQPSPSFQ